MQVDNALVRLLTSPSPRYYKTFMQKLTNRASGGFTIIELLVVIGVMTILLGVIIGAISGSRNAVNTTQVLSELRQSQMLFVDYLRVYDDLFPTVDADFDDNGDVVQLIRMDFEDGTFLAIHYFDQAAHWPAVLATKGYMAEELLTHASAGTEDRPFFAQRSTYWYGHAFITAPEYWMRSDGQTVYNWRPSRGSQVRYPGRKALLFDMAAMQGVGAGKRDTAAAVFMDGHAVSVRKEELTEPGVNSMYFGGTQFPMLTTADGVYGRDV